MRCGSSDNQCEVLRTCPACKQVLGRTGERIVHQSHCPEPLDVMFAGQQHEHAVTEHGYRRRRRVAS
jgi:hypothetical protein